MAAGLGQLLWNPGVHGRSELRPTFGWIDDADLEAVVERIESVLITTRRGAPENFDNQLDSSCPGGGRQFGEPIDREVG